MSPRSQRERPDEHGQIIVLFALSLVVLVALASLLYTGADSLVMRREFQNVGDAGALAGANVIQTAPKGCSAAGEGGAPRDVVKNAVKASVHTNLPGYDVTKIKITCPTGQSNMAVSVSLSGTSAAFFGGLAGQGMGIATKSSAVNGQATDTKYSVVMLDSSFKSWGSGYDGCASFKIGGGITATFEGSIFVDSTCQVAGSYVGAMDANGGSARVVMAAPSDPSLPKPSINLGGQYHKQNLVITPPPVENVRPLLADPLGTLVEPNTLVSLPAWTQNTVCKGSNKDPCTLQPGIYTGGINSTSITIFMKPGMYIMKGGGFNIGGGSVFALPTGKTSTNATTWASDCPLGASNCGVLIYNGTDATGSWTLNKDMISVGANANVYLRAYNHLADATFGAALQDYDHVLFWQARSPAPSAAKRQPTVTLGGGGTVILSGGIYTPGAQVLFGGTSGGGGGGLTNFTIQFICWDLQLQGNNNFLFEYKSSEFPRPLNYGLIQ